MHHYDALAEEVRETARERDAVARTVETRLADVVAEAITETGANVEAVEQSKAGHQYRFEARLDRAAPWRQSPRACPTGSSSNTSAMTAR
jgi:hypothetical protein